MANPIQREKMYEALAFFSAKVRYPGQLKLFKLLYYLDLMHFRRTGRTVTDLVYQAWPMGPVPAELNREYEEEGSELKRRFIVQRYRRLDGPANSPTIDTDVAELELAAASGSGGGHIPGSLKPKKPYKHQYLTRREQDLASDLAVIFKDATAEQMSDVSHQKLGPWRKALVKARQTGAYRPRIDLLEGTVAVGKLTDELPMDELRQIVAERSQIERAMR